MNKNTIKVLLIEDDIVDQTAFKRLVEKEDLPYDYEIANSVANAKAKLTKKKYDIVVADYHLGDGTAFEIFPFLKKTPFIFITGEGDEEIAVKALKAGAFHYQVKDRERNYLKVLPSSINKALIHKRTEDERQKVLKELRRSEAKHRILLKSIISPVLALWEDQKIFYCNNAYAEFVGKTVKELEGKNLLEIFPELEKTRLYESILKVFKTGIKKETEEKIGDKFIHTRIYRTPWGILLIANDITNRKNSENEIRAKNKELREAYKKLSKLARTDLLPNLGNRRELLEKIQAEINRFERKKNPFIIILGDIDDFKSINDNFGHDAGDYVLKTISKLMKSNLRKQDVISRWGGEEFLFLLPETDLTSGKRISERMRKNIENYPFHFKDKKINVTITFGVSIFDKIMNIDECFIMADKALYKGKISGKNCVVSANERIEK
ncbi:MAG TPA: diguanylate cyclase [Candidatus Cloacimonetes bacterium]|nr:diguanylate cyclase [Candidatus Cloacimonadota bacterium]